MNLAIEINTLRKVYGDLVAVDDLSLDVPEGQFLGFLGPNGAGKTTTISLLCGLSNPTSGEAKICGHDVVKRYRQARQCVGVVPQELNFDIFSRVKRLLMFQGGYFGVPHRERELQVDSLLKRFDLWDKRDAQMRDLSGGMKRRVMIARALVHKPRVLILDEPTAGVDVDLRKGMWAFLRELNDAGTTILLTTHYIEEAEAMCDRIAIMDGGRVIADESTRELANRLSRESYVFTTADVSVGPVLASFENYQPVLSADGHELTLTFDKSTTDFHSVMEAVLEAGVRVTHVAPVENRLESVFLELTQKGGSS